MYDFINDGDFPDDERAPYRLIRWWLLDCYYTYCRSALRAKRHGKNWDPEPLLHQLQYACEQCASIYDKPIEKLMFLVLSLVMWGGAAPAVVERSLRANIAEVLDQHDLAQMLAALQGEELQEFTLDLELLDLI